MARLRCRHQCPGPARRRRPVRRRRSDAPTQLRAGTIPSPDGCSAAVHPVRLTANASSAARPRRTITNRDMAWTLRTRLKRCKAFTGTAGRGVGAALRHEAEHLSFSVREYVEWVVSSCPTDQSGHHLGVDDRATGPARRTASVNSWVLDTRSFKRYPSFPGATGDQLQRDVGLDVLRQQHRHLGHLRADGVRRLQPWFRVQP